jgi:hypothetical protein
MLFDFRVSVMEGLVFAAGRPDRGRDREEFESLEDGRCCQERVPLRDKVVGFGAGMNASGPLGGVGRGREALTAAAGVGLSARSRDGSFGSFVGVDVDLRGEKSIGGSIARLAKVLESAMDDTLAAGEALEGDIERALSAAR